MHAKAFQHLDRQPHGVGIAFFVIMDAARQHDDRHAAEMTGNDLARMPGDGADRKARQIPIGNSHRIRQFAYQRAKAGAEHDAVTRHEPTEFADKQIDGGVHPSSVSKLKGRSSSIVMVFFTPISSQR